MSVRGTAEAVGMSKSAVGRTVGEVSHDGTPDTRATTETRWQESIGTDRRPVRHGARVDQKARRRTREDGEPYRNKANRIKELPADERRKYREILRAPWNG